MKYCNIGVLLVVVITVTLLGSEQSIAQWLPVVKLTDYPGLSRTSYTGGVNGRQVAVDQTDVHIVWYDERGAGSEIYYRRSSDEGDTWGEEVVLTNDAGNAIVPVIAAHASVVHVLWTDDRDGVKRTYYCHSSDRGVSWGKDMLLSSDSTECLYPSVVCSGGDAYVIWQNRSPIGLSIGFRRSTDGGATWEAEKILWRKEELESWTYHVHPSIAVSGNTLMYVWTNHPGADGVDLFTSRSTDNGQTWTEPVRITNSPSSDFLPCLAMSGNSAHVCWWSRDENRRIMLYYSRTQDGGNTWTQPRFFSDVGQKSSWRARLACSGENVHVVWKDRRIGEDVFYCCSTDAGETWGEDVRISEGLFGSAEEPSIAVHNTKLHIVWMETAGSNAEIFYRKNPTGNLTGVGQIPGATVEEFQLHQNYPNPCRDYANIRVTLPEPGSVRLSLFDLLGRRLAEYDRGMYQQGTHELLLPTEGLKPGSYLCLVEVGTEVRSLIITMM